MLNPVSVQMISKVSLTTGPVVWHLPLSSNSLGTLALSWQNSAIGLAELREGSSPHEGIVWSLSDLKSFNFLGCPDFSQIRLQWVWFTIKTIAVILRSYFRMHLIFGKNGGLNWHLTVSGRKAVQSSELNLLMQTYTGLQVAWSITDVNDYSTALVMCNGSLFSPIGQSQIPQLLNSLQLTTSQSN